MKKIKLLLSILFLFITSTTYAITMPDILIGEWKTKTSLSTYIFENNGIISEKTYSELNTKGEKTTCFFQLDWQPTGYQKFENAPDYSHPTYVFFRGSLIQANLISTINGNANECQEFVKKIKELKGPTSFFALALTISNQNPLEFILGYRSINDISETYSKIQ